MQFLSYMSRGITERIVYFDPDEKERDQGRMNKDERGL